MKKVSLFILFVFILLGLIACEKDKTPDEETVITDPIIIEDYDIENFDRLFNDEVEKSITIQISSHAWDDLDDEMVQYYQMFGNYRSDVYVMADFLYEDPDGIVEIEKIGFRTRGNLSRTRIQNDAGDLNLSNFKISFDEDFDNPLYSELKKRTAFGLEELDLKYNRNWDETYLSEKFALDLFNQFDVFAARTTLANLYIEIDDVSHFYGVYTLFEPIDQMFFEKRLTVEETEGNLYKSLWQQFSPASLQNNYQVLEIGMKDESINYRPTYDLKTNKKNPDHTELIEFIEQINTLTNFEFKSYIDQNFEVDMLLRLLAIGVLVGNPDDYRAMGNNYYLYQNSLTKKWMMVPYDYDHGMGQGWDGSPVFTNFTVGASIYEWGNLNASLLGLEDFLHPLTDKILNIYEYQVIYESYLAELIDPDQALFSYDVFIMKYLEQKNLYDDMIHTAMMNMNFGLRSIEEYFTLKIMDIQDQLDYYQNFPYLRGFE